MTTQPPTDAARSDEVNRIATMLMETWYRVDPKSDVTKHPVSYIANFADMARAVVDDPATRQQPEAGREGLGICPDCAGCGFSNPQASTEPCPRCKGSGGVAPASDGREVLWRERWYGSEPQRGSAIVDERGNLIAYFGGDEATHAATTKAVAAHNATRLAVPTDVGREEVARARAARIETKLTTLFPDWDWDQREAIAKECADAALLSHAEAGGVEGLREALGRIAALNDLSGAADDAVEAAARNALYECECIARDALAMLPASPAAVD